MRKLKPKEVKGLIQTCTAYKLWGWAEIQTQAFWYLTQFFPFWHFLQMWELYEKKSGLGPVLNLGFFVAQTWGCWGMVRQGRLERRFTKPHQAPLRENPQVLGVPDGAGGELCFGQARRSQTRCLKGGRSWGHPEPFLNQRRRNYLRLISRVGWRQRGFFLTRAKKNFELQGSQGQHPFPLPAPLWNLQGNSFPSKYSLKRAAPGVSWCPRAG